MPTVSEQFKTFHDFASASLDDIYGQRLASAYKREINTAESGIFINDGTGKFTFEPLPTLAQISPVFGISATHLDADGKLDLILAQNFHHPQRETGRMDGGLSLALLGNGDGSFRPLMPETSGLVVDGDSRSLTVLDLNGNHRPDLMIARNGAAPHIYFNNAAGAFYTITLKGAPANPTAIGARLTFLYKDSTSNTAEIKAGAGYLSQSPATLHHTTGKKKLSNISVHWPDGTISQHPVTKISGPIILIKPPAGSDTVGVN